MKRRPVLGSRRQTRDSSMATAIPRAKRSTRMPGSGLSARLAIRAGTHRGPTAGLAPGNVQGNLAILPQALAADFLRFCQLNPKPCPLIGTSAPGDPRVPELGEDLDIRTDLPRYRVWKNGELVAEPEDVREFWRDDLVSFVIGCSFSFEEALAAEGIELRHITRGCNVPMYRTSIATHRGGPVSRTDGRVDAADDAARRHSRGSDHNPLSIGARRASAYRQAGVDRHRRRHASRIMATRCRCATTSCRSSGPAGHAAIGDRDREAGILHHALSGQHAGDGPQEYRIRDFVRDTTAFSRHARPCAGHPVSRARLASLSEMAGTSPAMTITPRPARSCPAIRPRSTPDGCARSPRVRS